MGILTLHFVPKGTVADILIYVYTRVLLCISMHKSKVLLMLKWIIS